MPATLPLPRASREQNANTNDLLNPFFYGKALAEVLNERLGNLAADVLAEVGTLEAEVRKAMDEIQDEVVERAQREIQAGDRERGQMQGGRGGTQRGRAIAARAAVQVDEDEVVDNLRAEIASTRSLIQQTKSSTKR
jgi:hypothetical protein